ncbi:acyltransferase domain-containing protein [Streptomyces sp. NPDC060194]|uniref:acyltransferase domain-containing protein n=1 Tax=Streptomyces sp. NPDC060194 TaxID=3347069 RepID=UPI00365EF6B4
MTAAHLLTLAAPTPGGLGELARATLDLLTALGADSPEPLCRSRRAGVTGDAVHRIAVTGHSAAALADALSAHLAGDEHVRGVAAARAVPGGPRVAFLCSGQGAQFAGMGQDLYAAEPVYREAFDRCATAAAPHVEEPLARYLAPDAGPRIHRLPHAALLTFAVGCGLAALWRARGVEPAAVLGFSSGEYLAAHLAGVLTAEDAVALLATETSLAARVTDGAMAVVGADEETVRELLAGAADGTGAHGAAEGAPGGTPGGALGGTPGGAPGRAAPFPRLDVAALLSPTDVSVSGSAAELGGFTARLAARGVRNSPLPVPQGLHSPLQEPSLAALRAAAAGPEFAEPRLAMVSSVTGKRVGRDVLAAPDHWSAHMRGPVRFLDGVRALDALGVTAFVEVGPGKALTGLGPRCLPADADRLWLASIGRSTDGRAAMLRGLGRLFTAGAPVRLTGPA